MVTAEQNGLRPRVAPNIRLQIIFSAIILQRCSSSPKKRLRRSAPPSIRVGNSLPRSSCAGVSPALPTPRRRGNVPGRSSGGSRCPCRPARRRDCAGDHAKTNARGAAGRPVAPIPELGTPVGRNPGWPGIGADPTATPVGAGADPGSATRQCATRIAVVRQTGQRCGGAGDHGPGPQPMISRVIYEDRGGNVQPRAARSHDQGRRHPVASATAKGVRSFWVRRDRKRTAEQHADCLPVFADVPPKRWVGTSIPVAPIVTAAFSLAPAPRGSGPF